MKSNKKLPTNKPFPLSGFLLIPTSLFLLGFWMARTPHGQVRKITNDEYTAFKEVLKKPGTEFLTGLILSDDGTRTQRGTLITSSKNQFIIASAHFFGVQHPKSVYTFICQTEKGKKEFYLETILRQQKKGLLGENESDLVVCIPGERKVVTNFSTIPNKTTMSGIGFLPRQDIDPKQLFHLDSGKEVRVVGKMFYTPETPLLIVQIQGTPGMSGGGLLGNGRFFVITGGISDASEDVKKSLGMQHGQVSFISEF